MDAVKSYTTERGSLMDQILLDANEHYTQWVRIPKTSLLGLNRYPDRNNTELRQKLATVYCNPLKASNILITSGSIEAIDLLMIALRPSRLVYNYPTYDVYKHRAYLHHVQTFKAALTSDGQPNVSFILANQKPGDLLVLINPNNPTGQLIKPGVIDELCRKYKGLIVIDEAYIEYSGLHNSYQNFVSRYKNVLILRTFSKAWGLAGIRLGYVLASPRIIAKLQGYKNTYSVNAFAHTVGLAALDQAENLQTHIERVAKNKQQLLWMLQAIGVNASDTDANFVLMHVDDPGYLAQHLREKGIVVRPRPGIGNTHMLRITVGSANDNRELISAIKETEL